MLAPRRGRYLMDETLGSLRCSAPLTSGQPCGRPAVLLDCQTRRPVCLNHAVFLSEEQRALVAKVIGIVERGIAGGSDA